MDRLGNDDLNDYLLHALEETGAPQLMTGGLIADLVDHAKGNLRRLCHVAARLVWLAAERNLAVIDENVFLDFCTPDISRARRSS